VSVVGRLLAFARRRRALVLAAAALFATVSAVLCTRISFGTDVLNLLPQSSPSLQGFRRYLERFGTADQLYIVFEAKEGGTIEDARPAIDAYLTRLGALPEITKIDAGMFDPGRDWTYVQSRTFALIGPPATRAALARFEEQGMRAALLQSRELLATPSPEIRALVQSDPLGLLSLVREHFATSRAFANIDVGRGGYLSADGRSRLVMATPASPPFDGPFCRRLFAKLSEIEAAARQEAVSGGGDAASVRIEYAGGHRIAFETEAIIKEEALFNSVTSIAGILLLLLIVFRSPWLFFVGAIPMSLATLGSVAINGMLRQQLSAAATGTSALLFGLGIDGLVLLYVRYLQEVESGTPAPAAIERLSGAGASMLLGCFTTAATFFALTWSDLPGLQELGRLVGVGMLLGGPLTLLLVAAMLPARMKRARTLSAHWLSGFVRRRNRVILAAAALITLAALPAMAGLDLDLRLQRLQPDTPAVHLQQDLGRRFGVDRDVAIALAEHADLAELLALDRRFERDLSAKAPGLSASGPSRFVPPAAEQDETARILSGIAPEIPAIQARLRRIAADVGFRPAAIDGFVEALPRVLDPGQRLTYQGYADHGLGDLVSRYIAVSPTGFTTASYIEINGPQDLVTAAAVTAAPGGELTFTGIPVVNKDLASRFRPQFLVSLAAGLVAVVVLMFITFRRIGLTLLALSPTILGLIWAAALLARMKVSLDLFSIFAVLSLIGIGVDYGIHLVHRAATEPGSLDEALARVAPANLVAAGIALLGCGSLVTSAYPPLKSLGIVTVVGLCTCLVTAVLVLPALLMAKDPDSGIARLEN